MIDFNLTEVYIALGSNMGDRNQNLEDACRFIESSAGKIIKRSSVYETEPWGFHQQPDFFNQTIKIETTFAPDRLMKELLAIEENMGRIRTFKNASRVIDIDILFYGDRIINNEHVTIPHPSLEKRKFVLIPLNEIAPELIHPVRKKSVGELLLECMDPLKVERVGV